MGGGGTASYSPVNLTTLENLVSGQAAKNLPASQQLQQQYNPALWQAQQSGQSALSSLVPQATTTGTLATQGANAVAGSLGYNPQTITMPTLAANPIQAQTNNLVAQRLQNPGALPWDVRNQLVQQGASQAGQTGTLNGSGGQNISDAALGLNSLSLSNANIGLGNTVGQQNQALAQQQQGLNVATQGQNVGYGLQNQSRLPVAASALTQGYGQSLSPLYFSQGLGLPQSGIDPGALGSAYVANQNAMNQFAQQQAANQTAQNNAWLGFGGGLLGALGSGLALSGAFGGSTPTNSYGGAGSTPILSGASSINPYAGGYSFH